MAVNIVINGIAVAPGNCAIVGNKTTCTIDGTYGNVVVTGIAAGSAQVVFVDDINLPKLTLQNAKFRATAAAVNGSMTFTATSTQGRPGPKMRRMASGWLVRQENVSASFTSPANRGQFTVDGVVTAASMNPNAESIDGLLLGGDTPGSSKVVLGAQPFALGEINAVTFTKTENMPALAAGPRTLKGEFTFHLCATNDFLRLAQFIVETLDPAFTGDEMDAKYIGYLDTVSD